MRDKMNSQYAKISHWIVLAALAGNIFPHNHMMEIPPVKQLQYWTHSRRGSGFQSTHWFLDSSINTHGPFCRRPRNLWPLPELFCNHSLHTASEKHICQEDRSVRTAVIFWLSNLMRQRLVWEQTVGITLVDLAVVALRSCWETERTKHGRSHTVRYVSDGWLDGKSCRRHSDRRVYEQHWFYCLT